MRGSAYVGSCVGARGRRCPTSTMRSDWHTWVGLAHMMLGDDRKALEQSKRSAAANPHSAGAFTLQAAALALLGREDEARAALAVRQQIGSPDLTITTIKEGSPSDYPEYSRLMERYYEGLRQAGLPE